MTNSPVPVSPFPDIADPAEQQAVLDVSGWLQHEERITTSAKAGDGNMNLTLRLHTSQNRTVILKQARPWVEKYPDIAAPQERIAVESAFYATVSQETRVARQMPALLHFATSHNCCVFEDLGDGRDCADLYTGGKLNNTQLQALGRWLGQLHQLQPAAARQKVLRNRAMRALNHAHIFAIPLDPDNGLDLATFGPELQAAATTLRADRGFCTRVQDLGRQYLADGPTLLHGDYYPGSWLRADSNSISNGVAVIDPEFGFLGPAAFDLGVTLGHLHMAGQADRWPLFLDAYTSTGKTAPADDQVAAFAGVEIMRRLLGVAQLPLATDCDRVALLATAQQLVRPAKEAA